MTLLKFTDRHKKWTRFDISDFRDATEQITWASKNNTKTIPIKTIVYT